MVIHTLRNLILAHGEPGEVFDARAALGDEGITDDELDMALWRLETEGLLTGARAARLRVREVTVEEARFLLGRLAYLHDRRIQIALRTGSDIDGIRQALVRAQRATDPPGRHAALLDVHVAIIAPGGVGLRAEAIETVNVLRLALRAHLPNDPLDASLGILLTVAPALDAGQVEYASILLALATRELADRVEQGALRAATTESDPPGRHRASG